MFVRFNTRALNTEQRFTHSSTTELLFDSERTKEDSDGEEEEEEEEKEESDAMDESEDAAPSPASNRVMRATLSLSTRAAHTVSFLTDFISKHNLKKGVRFNADLEGALMDAALHDPRCQGGSSLPALIQGIRAILASNNISDADAANQPNL